MCYICPIYVRHIYVIYDIYVSFIYEFLYDKSLLVVSTCRLLLLDIDEHNAYM